MALRAKIRLKFAAGKTKALEHKLIKAEYMEMKPKLSMLHGRLYSIYKACYGKCKHKMTRYTTSYMLHKILHIRWHSEWYFT